MLHEGGLNVSAKTVGQRISKELKMLRRIPVLARALSLAPLSQQAHRPQSVFWRKSQRAFASSRKDDEDDDDDMENWDDVDDDDEEFDFDDLEDDDDDLSWLQPGNGERKVEEQVKQKVRIQRAKHTKRRFVDRIRIKATGGHGGNGCSSFFSKIGCFTLRCMC